MCIDVDQPGIEPQVQHVRGMPAVIEHVPVTQPRGIAQQPVAHRAAVHVPELAIGTGARRRRQTQPAADLHSALLHHRQRARQEIGAEDAADA